MQGYRGQLRTHQTSKMKYFAKIGNGWKPLTFLAKCFILDVWQGPGSDWVRLLGRVGFSIHFQSYFFNNSNIIKAFFQKSDLWQCGNYFLVFLKTLGSDLCWEWFPFDLGWSDDWIFLSSVSYIIWRLHHYHR